MKKSYISPEFEFWEIELTDSLVSGSVEPPATDGNHGGVDPTDGWDDF